MKDMYILGIESSCDETSASIVKNGTTEIATIISSQTKRITRVILAFLASLLTISINPIGMILLDFINWRHINSFADYFSKAYWIIFLIHMLLFWLCEEIGYFSQKGLF